MDRHEFMGLIASTIWQEGHMSKKERTIKACVNLQRQNINKIAKQLGITPLSYDEVEKMGY